MNCFSASGDTKAPANLKEIIRAEIKDKLGYKLRMDDKDLLQVLDKFMTFGVYDREVVDSRDKDRKG